MCRMQYRNSRQRGKGKLFRGFESPSDEAGSETQTTISIPGRTVFNGLFLTDARL
jgi:hypothetical protein